MSDFYRYEFEAWLPYSDTVVLVTPPAAVVARIQADGVREATVDQLCQEIANRLRREWIAPNGRRYETTEQKLAQADPPF